MTVLSDIFETIFDHEINSPSHVNNVVGGLNDSDKCYLKEKM